MEVLSSACHGLVQGPNLSTASLQVIIRDHSYYSQDLYDAIMAEWAPLTEKDILVISYGGWYPRFAWQSDQVQNYPLYRLCSSRAGGKAEHEARHHCAVSCDIPLMFAHVTGIARWYTCRQPEGACTT